MRFILILLILLVIASSTAAAFGVSPARKHYDYAPHIEGHFTIVNVDRQNADIIIVPRGDLAEYVSLDQTVIRMRSDDDRVRVEYTLQITEDAIDPGENTIDFYILSESESRRVGDTMIATAMGIVSQAVINAPYPGTYIRARLDYDRQMKRAIIPITNLGSENIQELRADVSLIGPTNEIVASASSDTVSLTSQKMHELIISLPEVESGTYLMRATITYDGRTKIEERTITHGNPQIAIQNIEIPDYYFGSISKVEVTVKSEWNEPIENAHALLEFYDTTSTRIGSARSSEETIPPFARETFDVFWDSSAFAPGTYDLKVTINYKDQSVERTFPTTLTPNTYTIGTAGRVVAEEGTGTPLLILGFIVLVILNITLIVLIMRRNKK